MNETFEIAAGTITGRDHALAGKNNQDSFYWEARNARMALIVCDGCGSSSHSEVGAYLGARWCADALLTLLDEIPDALATESTAHALFVAARNNLLNRLWVTTAARSENENTKLTRDAFLFTVVGALMTSERTALFTIGDGVIVLNGEVLRIGPFPGNEPPYLAYAMRDPRAAIFTIHRLINTAEINSLLIATDGMADWEPLESRTLPGRTDSAGPLSRFWKDDRFFANADAIRRTLALMNRPAAIPDWERRTMLREPGLLRDDATLIVARRRREAGGGPQL